MTLKINFCDFWPGFEKNNLLLKFLEKHFRVSIDNNPDYLFFSVYGNKHFNFNNSIKILYTGENLIPDFNLCDYALGFHYLEFGDRYLRFPLYVYYLWYYSDLLKNERCSNRISNRLDSSIIDQLLSRKFCNFVYSNNANADPLRDLFFHKLNKYKKVDSGGRHLNNIGQSVTNKLEFIKDYKFTIAFENSSIPGYTTEKLIEPIIVKSLPVYYGNPLVNQDFNIEALIQVKGIHDLDRSIEEIIYLDRTDEIYIEKLRQPKFSKENNLEYWEDRFLVFLRKIFDQPHQLAGRRAIYGFNKFYTEEMKIQTELFERRKTIIRLKALIKNKLFIA
jgi:alpha(1,3/1,4) fucosyltransferase